MALVAAIAAPVLFVARPAAADDASDLRTQATQISQAMIREQLQIGAYEQQYEVSTQKVGADANQIAGTQQRVADDQQRIAADRQRLQNEAVNIYVNFGYSSSEATQLFDSEKDSLLANEYQEVVFGNTDVTIDQLHTEQGALLAAQSSLRQQQAADQALQSHAATLLDDAQRTRTS